MAPVFPFPMLELNVSEDAFDQILIEEQQQGKRKEENGQRMHILGRLEALDQDRGHFGRLSYALGTWKGNANGGTEEEAEEEDIGPFWIEPQSGVLSLIGPLDREEK